MAALAKLRFLDPRWKAPEKRLTGDLRKRAYTISWATGGMLTDGNVDAIYTAVSKTCDLNGAIVEIGAFCGLSSNLIAYVQRIVGSGQPFYSMDPWSYGDDKDPESTLSPYCQIPWPEYEKYIVQAYIERVRFFSRDNLPFGVRGYSGEVMEKWRRGETVEDVFGRSIDLGGDIAFAYIDGDHTYEGALSDFNDVNEFLLPGGVILFDDSAQGSGRGCERVAAEVANRPDFRLIGRNPNYLVEKTA